MKKAYTIRLSTITSNDISSLESSDLFTITKIVRSQQSQQSQRSSNSNELNDNVKRGDGVVSTNVNYDLVYDGKVVLVLSIPSGYGELREFETAEEMFTEIPETVGKVEWYNLKFEKENVDRTFRYFVAGNTYIGTLDHHTAYDGSRTFEPSTTLNDADFKFFYSEEILYALQSKANLHFDCQTTPADQMSRDNHTNIDGQVSPDCRTAERICSPHHHSSESNYDCKTTNCLATRLQACPHNCFHECAKSIYYFPRQSEFKVDYTESNSFSPLVVGC